MWELTLPAAITAIVGWMVKSLLDAVKDYAADSHRWRMGLDAKIDTIMGATQTTMRANLIHTYEKYADRGWLTPEERASWCDMHDKYSAMGFNGLIDGYRHKLDQLPDREI